MTIAADPFAGIGRGYFGAILTDVPSRFEAWSDKGRGRSAERHYPDMTSAAFVRSPACLESHCKRSSNGAASKKDHGRAEASLIALFGPRTSRFIAAQPGSNVKFEQLDLLLLLFPQRGEQA